MLKLELVHIWSKSRQEVLVKEVILHEDKLLGQTHAMPILVLQGCTMQVKCAELVLLFLSNV